MCLGVPDAAFPRTCLSGGQTRDLPHRLLPLTAWFRIVVLVPFGQEFFKRARSRLPYEVFAEFLANIKKCASFRNVGLR